MNKPRLVEPLQQTIIRGKRRGDEDNSTLSDHFEAGCGQDRQLIIAITRPIHRHDVQHRAGRCERGHRRIRHGVYDIQLIDKSYLGTR